MKPPYRQKEFWEFLKNQFSNDISYGLFLERHEDAIGIMIALFEANDIYMDYLEEKWDTIS